MKVHLYTQGYVQAPIKRGPLDRKGDIVRAKLGASQREARSHLFMGPRIRTCCRLSLDLIYHSVRSFFNGNLRNKRQQSLPVGNSEGSKNISQPGDWAGPHSQWMSGSTERSHSACKTQVILFPLCSNFWVISKNMVWMWTGDSCCFWGYFPYSNNEPEDVIFCADCRQYLQSWAL